MITLSIFLQVQKNNFLWIWIKNVVNSLWPLEVCYYKTFCHHKSLVSAHFLVTKFSKYVIHSINSCILSGKTCESTAFSWENEFQYNVGTCTLILGSLIYIVYVIQKWVNFVFSFSGIHFIELNLGLETAEQ